MSVAIGQRTILFALVLFLSFFQDLAAPPAVDAQTAVRTWARLFGGVWDDVPTAVEPTPDGGYVVAGWTGSFDTTSGGFGPFDFWILRLDAAGNLVWQRTYGGASSDVAAALRPTGDGGYVVAGYTHSFGAGHADAWVIKIDASGAIVWQKSYGGTSLDIAEAIDTADDGGFVVAGRTFSFGAGNADVWVLKLDAAGAVVWQKTYGGSALDQASAVLRSPDGGYVVAGTSRSFGGGNLTRIWMLKLDATGAVEWQNTYHSGPEYSLSSLEATSDGGYVAAGMLSHDLLIHDLWVLKLSAAGDVEWHTFYGGAGDDRGGVARQSAEGGYVLAGASESFGGGGGTGEAWLLKLDPAGKIAWQKTIGPVATEQPVTPAPVDDGGYVVVAAFDTGVPYPYAVLKLDAAGNLPMCCDAIEATAVVASERFTTVRETSSVVSVSTALVSDTTTPGDEPQGVQTLPCTLATPFAAYATNSQQDEIYAYTIAAATGALTAVPGSPFASGPIPVELTADPFGEFVYVSHNLGQLRGYRTDTATGALSEVPGSPFSAGNSPRSMAVDSFGRRLYVGNSGSRDISGLTLDRATGDLTALAGSPFALGFAPRAFVLDPAGRFAYVTDSAANTVAVYAVDPLTGALTETAASPFATGIGPAEIALDPSGVFAFVANSFGNNISAYAIDAAGALSEVPGSPFTAGTRPSSVVVDPTARFLYALNITSRDISAYRIDAGSGALTPVPGSPFAFSGGGRLAVEASGRYLYVATLGHDGIVALAIDAVSGALTPVPGSPFGGGPGLFDLTTIPTPVACTRSAADLALTQTAEPDPVMPGDDLTVTITVTNAGPDDAQDVVVTDLLPAETSFLSCTAPSSTCTQAGRQQIVTIPALSAGASTTATLVATVGLLVADDTAFSNTATVGSSTSDADLSNNSATVTVSTPFNTPVGNDVVVRPVDPATLTRPVTLSFATVTQEGTSELLVSGSGPAPPALFKAGVPALYYELTTSAQFVGPITVCIDYSAASFADVAAVRLFHYESNAWVDTTTSVDAPATTVCGAVAALSPFAVFEPVQPGSLSFSAATYSAGEEAASAVVEVRRTGGSDGTVTVTYATSDGSATSPDDYAASSAALTFADGETSRSFTVTLVDDSLSEGDETVSLALSGPTGGAVLGNPASAVLTVLDEDSPPGVLLAGVTLTEGDSGTVEALFTASLSRPSSQLVTADFGTVGDTATAGSDFTATSGTLDFPPGTLSRTVSVTVRGDILDEDDETFFVDLNGPVELYAYAANSGSHDLSVYRINTLTGAAAEVAGSPVATGGRPRSVVADPHGRFVYVVNNASGTVSAYQVDAASGALSAIAGSPFVTGPGSRKAAVDPTGRFFYVAHSTIDFDVISAFAIDAATGALAPVPGSPFATEPDAFMVAVDPSGRFLYAANFTTNRVTGYTIDAATGALAPVPGSPFAAALGPMAVTIDPGGSFVYIVNSSSFSVSAYAIDAATGTLTEVAGSPFLAGGSPFDVAAEPSGRFLYVANPGSNDISAYEIDAGTGALTPLPGSPFAGSDPYALSVDPAGRFLFVANFTTGDMSVFAIDPAGGALTLAPGSPVAAGLRPEAMVTQASGTRGLGVILDDDPVPSLSIADVVVAEHISDPVDAEFTVLLSAAGGREVTVDFATLDGTATAGLDYTAAAGGLSFPPGTTARTVTVTIRGDALNEMDETFSVRLAAANAATIADGEGLGTILDAPNTPVGAGVVVQPVDLASGSQPATLTFSSVTQAGTSELTLSGTGPAVPAGFKVGDPSLYYDLATSALLTGPITVCIDYSTASFADETTLRLFHFEGSAWVDHTTSLDPATKTICAEVTTLSPFAVFEPVTPGNLRFGQTAYAAAEGDGTVTVTVERVNGSDGTVTVVVATSDGTASAPQDYTALSETLTFAAGETVASLTVTVVDDTLSEADETVSLDLGGGAALESPASAILTIGDHDPLPGLSIDDVTVTEAAVPVEAVFTVRLSTASGQEVTVEVATSDGSATAPADYQAASDSLTLPAGATEKSFSVTVLNDSLDEDDEGFFVDLTSAQRATISHARGAGTIVDRPNTPAGAAVVAAPIDPATGSQPVTLTFTQVTQAGDTSLGIDTAGPAPPADFKLGSPAFYYDLTTTALFTGPITVCIDTSAASFADATQLRLFHFEASAWVDRTTSLDPASTSVCGEVTSLSPFAVFESLQHGSLRFSSASYGLGENEGTVTITVERLGGSDGAVSVDVATSDGSATALDDYAAMAETLTFAAGESVVSFAVVVVDDALSEAEETVRLDLSSPTGGAFLGSPASAVLTIGDDDPLPTLSIDDATATERDAATAEARFTVSLSAPSGQSVTVDYATADGTAEAGLDYESRSGTMTFPPGVTTQSLLVTILADTIVETTETFLVDLFAPGQAVLGDDQGQATIWDSEHRLFDDGFESGDLSAWSAYTAP